MPNAPSERSLHPASALFELASHLRQLVLPGLLVLIAGARGSDSWQVYAMVFFAPIALASVARTLVFRYSLEDDDLVIRSGLIFRQQRHVPYARIQNIDAIQTIVHRLLRVTEVRLETAGGEEPEAHLKVVSLPAFDELRTKVHERRSASMPPATQAGAGVQPPGAGVAPAATATPLLQLSLRELAIAGLIQGRGLIAIGALFGLLWETGLADRLMAKVSGPMAEGRGISRELVLGLMGKGIPSIDKLAITAAAFLGVLIVVRALSVGWALVRLHGFTLVRAGDDLRVDFGLLTRVAATIPIRRIQSVTVHEGPLHRLFKRVSVHVQTAGGERGKAVEIQRQWLAPVIRPGAAAALLEQIGPSPAGIHWEPVERRGIRRARVRALVFSAMATLITIGLLGRWSPVVFIVLALFGELNARKSIKALGWKIADGALFFRSGWWWRRVSIAPLHKIQVVALHESPFDRRLSMASVEVDTAGMSEEGHHIRVPYLARATADHLAAQLAARAGETAFRW